MFNRIVVTLDGSDVSQEALPVGAELASRLGVPLHLIRVADLAWMSVGAADAALEYSTLGDTISLEEQGARDYLEEVAKSLDNDKLTITTEVRTGFAAREIIAAVTPDDMLVMASHGRTGPARWLLGSVAEDVTRRAPCPVLLVRAAGAAEKTRGENQ